MFVTTIRGRRMPQYAKPDRGQARERTAVVGNFGSRLQIGRGAEGAHIAAIATRRTNELRGLRQDQHPGGDGKGGEQPEGGGDGDG